MFRGRYSIDEFESLTDIDRDFTEEETTLFKSYNDDFDDMVKYEDYLLPSLRVELMKYKDDINTWSMQDGVNKHKKAAIDSYEKNMQVQEQLSYTNMHKLVLKKEKKYDNFGFSSFIQIIGIVVVGIGILVALTLIAL